MKDYRLEKIGASKYNQAIKTPKHKTKSHAVVAKVGDEIRLIRFGQQGVDGSPYKKGESIEERKRRIAFKKRHAQNIKKGKLSPAYWSDKIKW